ncbi:putative mitochondrial dehydrogenase-like protein [Leptomonas pyrrhocoris]|uniref:Putative mitochondrial dehydrogenase-like protein n=1 Tax=Leptomonas pyrrhocoris TaxID=157538 RepID=A0A0N1J4R5_LEPPY|nr:putative mitochondrial dehydrogenase-like protein [Leptomonas pyrrhocoris]KPA79544.1 putative mitochondrial dehydrogenase-like protein [Leptomonas pyrrhocoris]|eukprot:XP_015657983.1 putative mitochondrial dehydrogenase-like protein [Leptomonas pyrrhocoris]
MSAVKRSLNVGVVGMGNMGIPITRNLAFKARSAMYLQVHSRSVAKARKVCDDMSADGATCAMRIHDRYSTVTKWCDIILLTLAHREASRKVLLEDDEALITHARPGQILVDHTTVDIELSRECAFEAERRGATFLDAPMSGSPKAAFNNQLVLMIGGPAEQVQRVSPIFRMYADNIHHMGQSGSGTAAKLLSQALVASHNAAAAEAMTIANRLGIEDYQTLLQVLDASWGSSTMLRRNAPIMQDLVRNPEKLAPSSGATVDSLLSDLALLDASLPAVEGGRGGAPKQQEEEEHFPVLDASLRMLGAAAASGLGDRDMSTVIHYIQAAAAMESEEEGVGPAAVPRALSTEAFQERRSGAASSSSSTSTSSDQSTGVEAAALDAGALAELLSAEGDAAPTSKSAATTAPSTAAPSTNVSAVNANLPDFTMDDFY